jgi:hypothetical protein
MGGFSGQIFEKPHHFSNPNYLIPCVTDILKKITNAQLSIRGTKELQTLVKTHTPHQLRT